MSWLEKDLVVTMWDLQVVGLGSFGPTAGDGSWLRESLKEVVYRRDGVGGFQKNGGGVFLGNMTWTHSGMKMLMYSVYTPFPSPGPVGEFCFFYHQVYYVPGIMLGT